MQKDSFILYKSFYEPLKMLSDKQLGKLFKAIFEYQINDCIGVDPDIQMAFAFIKNQMDLDNVKYQEKIRKNKENGQKGGRPPKKDIPDENQAVFNETQKSERLFTEPKKAYNENDNEYDNDILLEKESKGIEVEESLQEEKKEIEEPVIHPDEKKEKSCAKKEKEIIEYFHEQCSLLPKVQIVGETRKKAIKARIKDVGVERVMQVIRLTGESSFLNGENDRGWSADFDWIMKPTNFTKILEGNYRNRTNGHNQTTSTGSGNKGPVQANQVQRRNNQFTIDDFTVPS
ncbi:hypothetical protein HZP66_02165 [Elizabethkingia anophelis]|nr:hypothetical protein [Elizabethkingia anophelis]